MADTAVLSVWDALGQAIDSGVDPPLSPTGGQVLGNPRFYRGVAPVSAVLGYFLLGLSTETEAGFYGQPGQQGTYRIHCWSDTPTNANRLYRWLKQQIHDRRLALVDHQMIRGTLTKLTDAPDPDWKAWQVESDYTVQSLEA